MKIRQHFGGAGAYCNIVLNAARADAAVIQPGLDRYDISRAQNAMPRPERRRLVDFQPEPVPRGMEKSAPMPADNLCFKARPGKIFLDGRVRRRAVGSAAYQAKRGELRAADSLYKPRLLGGGDAL